LRILFLDRSTKLETVYDLQTRPRGGMVSSLFKVSDYLASLGHDVTVLSDIQHTGVTRAGVKWLHDAWGVYDAFILNRGVGSGYSEIEAKARFLWTHDLPHNGFIPEPKTIKAFAATVFMSRYAERVWRKFYPDIGAGFQIPNGVDRKIFYPRQKDLDYLIYASAPNRGLNKLPLIFDAIRARTGREMRMEAYSRMSVLHPNELVAGNDTFDYTPIEESAVTLCDPVPQEVLANKLGQAGLMILPTSYPEICSNTILQAIASGTPVITTGALGSSGEWVKHRRNGMLTEFHPGDYMVHTVEMVRNAVEVLENGALHEKLIRNALKTRILSWQEVGAKWERMLSLYC
jgi:glycosyltransferase involved in cell wall biosynthesis